MWRGRGEGGVPRLILGESSMQGGNPSFCASTYETYRDTIWLHATIWTGMWVSLPGDGEVGNDMRFDRQALVERRQRDAFVVAVHTAKILVGQRERP